MKKLLLSGVALVALAIGPAMAADLNRPVYKAPPPQPPAPVLSWTGWYVGLNAGGAWSNNNDIDNSITSTFCNTGLTGCAPNQVSNALAAAVPNNFGTGQNASFIGGGQIGYNYQTGQAVWGFEADFQGLDLKGNSNVVSITTIPITTATVTGTASEKLDMLGTVRGRLGWTPTPPWLLYVTGGLAYGHTQTDVSFASSFTNCFCGPNPFTSASNDQWRAGWTAGGGVEWMITRQWSLKGEYLFYDLGNVTVNNTLNQLNGAAVPFVAVGIASEAHYRGNIARVGVNYHF